MESNVIWSCINIKGGTAKTTSTILLASAAVQDGKTVKVYDTDPQASATLWALQADEIGDPLPYPVLPANVGTIRHLAHGKDDELVIIDCPPSGNIVDEVAKVSDFIIIPSSPRSADLSKTFETVATFEDAGKPYAVLLTSARKGTLALKGALSELEDEGVSFCSSVIYQREELASYFGNSLPLDGDLYGYSDVYKELKEATGYGD
ncbi:MAG: ParA family protein [Faecousia sp.]